MNRKFLNPFGIGSYDKRICIESWQNFANLLLLSKTQGPSCSKLTMSLVNVSLKFFIFKYGIWANIFAEKMRVAFVKATHIFSAKIHVNYIVPTRTVNFFTTNELVKLTMLWTTGPRQKTFRKMLKGEKLLWLYQSVSLWIFDLCQSCFIDLHFKDLHLFYLCGRVEGVWQTLFSQKIKLECCLLLLWLIFNPL